MKSPLVPLLLGIAFAAGAVAIDLQQRAIQGADRRDVMSLRAELDSVRAALGAASTAADSIRLRADVERRFEMLKRREFHIPSRQEAIDGWWRPVGPGVLLAAVGLLLIGLAGAQWRRGAA